MSTIKVEKGVFFCGNFNAQAPKTFKLPKNLKALLNEQLRDIVEGFLLGNLSSEDTEVFTKLAKEYLKRKAIDSKEKEKLQNALGLLILKENKPS